VSYCREVEAYLCRKNDGHLIRVVGPSFELVSRWEAEGVPLRIAFRGIDRYFERYYQKGPRRRPVRIDFCDADVRDAFDEWRRAIGLAREVIPPSGDTGRRRSVSLRAHLERALLCLTDARATGVLGPEADGFIDRLAAELDVVLASSRGLRGDARRTIVERLEAFDQELLELARAFLDDAARRSLEGQVDEDLAAYRHRMSPEAYERAREAALGRLARERYRLPTLTYAAADTL
jgi:hypothetical protein